MQNTIIVFLSVILILVIGSCNSTKSPESLKSWEGRYIYEETPIKAIAGYSMVMEWTLDIHKEADKYVGNLEVNGQQTYIKLQSKIIGNEKTISLLYSNNIEGSSENLQPADTLFKLVKRGSKLITMWAKLEPRLSENPPKQCTCFRQ